MNVQERQSMVREFMRKMGEPISDTPELPTEIQAALRVELILEEVMELARALGMNAWADVESPAPGAEPRIAQRVRPSGRQIDLVEVVDAIRDIEYLIHGIELILGLHDASDDTFREVHRSNMDKEPLGSGEQRKVTKPGNWKPPQIRDILRKKYPKKALLFRK